MAASLHDTRSLGELVSVGPATLRDLELLGITSVDQLAVLEVADAADLRRRLGELTGTLPDICVQDVFAAAIAQARDPGLPQEQRNWWWWSRKRKAGR